MSVSRKRVRAGALAFAIAAVLFLLYPAVRPWEDESTAAGARAAYESGAWVASHLFAMIGFVLVPLGLLALHAVVRRTQGEPVALAALVTSWIGVGLTLPYYGAEDFGLNAIATRAAEGDPLDLLSVTEAVRFSPVAATTFAAGLLALAIGAVLAAVAVWRSRVLPRFSGLVFALGFALFIPQFYAPPAVRIGHGALVAVGLIWMATALWTATPMRAGSLAAQMGAARQPAST